MLEQIAVLILLAFLWGPPIIIAAYLTIGGIVKWRRKS